MRRKYIIKRFELLILALLPMAVGAEEVKINGLWYEIDTSGGTAEVTHSGVSGDLIIPSSVTYAEQSYSVTSIGYWAFGECSGLTSVSIPNSVTSIGEQAFSKCTGLTSVTIPNSVISIGRGAFWGCTNLSTITIPNSVTSIGFDTFGSCSGLASITVESGNSTYDSRDNCNAIVETASNTLIRGCNTTVLPSGVTSIGRYAFSNLSGLSTITIPSSVTTIGYGAFEYCSGLTSVTIPNSVTSIGNSAFRNCSGLTSITIGSGVASITKDVLDGCTNLTSAHINSNSIVSKTYTYDNNLITIFGRQVKEYVLGDDVKTIGNYAFYGSANLTSVIIPNDLTSIGNYAFYNCTGLTSVTIPNGVTSIGNDAFSSCAALTSITIPNSVTSIGSSAFSGSSGLTSVRIEVRLPVSISSDCFSNRANATLYVPYGSKATYESSPYWNEFKEIIEIPDQTLALSELPVMMYGDATYELPATTAEGKALTWSSSDENVALISGNIITVTGAGTATITATRAGDDGYLPFSREFTLTVNKAMLTITADDCTKQEGDPNPHLTVSYSGFVYDDDASSLYLQPLATTTATTDSPAGTYPITVSGAVSGNYEFTYISGQLTVTAKQPDVAKGDLNGDGTVSISDVVLIIDVMAGTITDANQVAAADVNGDGSVSITDCVAAIDLIASQAGTGSRMANVNE